MTLLNAAKRFLGLYQASEHEGESWGDGEAQRRRADDLAAAIEECEARAGQCVNCGCDPQIGKLTEPVAKAEL